MKTFTKTQASALLKLNQQVFPAFYKNFSTQDAEMLVLLWVDLFKDTNADLVTHTFRQAIKESDFPLTPSDVNKRIKAMQKAQEPSDTELWAQFVGAARKICNLAYYHLYGNFQEFEKYKQAKEFYETLPPPIKEFAHSVREMAHYGSKGDDELTDFVKPQFLKRMPDIKAREEFLLDTPPQLLAMTRHDYAPEMLRQLSASANDVKL